MKFVVMLALLFVFFCQLLYIAGRNDLYLGCCYPIDYYGVMVFFSGYWF